MTKEIGSVESKRAADGDWNGRRAWPRPKLKDPVRISVLVERSEYERLAGEARRLGISISSAIRKGIECLLPAG